MIIGIGIDPSGVFFPLHTGGFGNESEECKKKKASKQQ